MLIDGKELTKMNDNMKRDIVFWSIISGIITALMLWYLIKENPSLVPLAFSPVVGLIFFLFGAKKKNRQSFAITNLYEFIIVNTMFLLLFLFSLFSLRADYQLIQIILFFVFTAVGAYNSLIYFKMKTR